MTVRLYFTPECTSYLSLGHFLSFAVHLYLCLPSLLFAPFLVVASRMSTRAKRQHLLCFLPMFFASFCPLPKIFWSTTSAVVAGSRGGEIREIPFLIYTQRNYNKQDENIIEKGLRTNYYYCLPLLLLEETRKRGKEERTSVTRVMIHNDGSKE